MSTYNFIFCKNCKEHVHIGQGGGWLYGGDQSVLEELEQFIKRHRSYYAPAFLTDLHEVVFWDEHSMYEYLDATNGWDEFSKKS